MVSKSLLVVGYFYFFSYGFLASENRVQSLSNLNSDAFTVIELPSFNANSCSVDSGCTFANAKKTKIYSVLDEEEVDDGFDDGFDEVEHEDFKLEPTVVLNLKHRSAGKKIRPMDSVLESTAKDLNRIQTLHTRIVERKKQKTASRIMKHDSQPAQSPIFAPVPSPESGVSLGSGEYLMDVFMGTPPKHFSLILDTGSDLNWIQCDPCYDCFEQTGPYYDPKESSSFRNISCHDPRCHLVSSPDPSRSCKAEDQSCPYYYWYGDSSNTTGDFALETFTVNLTTASGKSQFKKVENVMFGCGHWNRGLFHGAAGVLGLGRGALSFSSQLQSLYGDSFSYCLVDRNSNSDTVSKLIFGEDKDLLSHPGLNFTALVAGKENPVNTFYYVQIKTVMVGGEELNIPEETWNISSDGAGGTIIDSGTTLSYFADPAYKIIKEAFVKKVKGYPVVKDFPILDPCYNISGVDKLELPSLGFVFGDGAIWNFPVENYFIKLEPENVVCLAILGTPRSALSIIGNYQQQNFRILYDTKRSRLGFALTKCADI
ncbi:hypothetical protein Pfo_022213 [Paulownia fortunei]|nr:hypothetical protein Pfo_022213 [Paulownia fortunei]